MGKRTIGMVLGGLTLMLLLGAKPGVSAEYQGRNIDGKSFAAKVYSYATGGLFDAEVEFRGDVAQVRFASGGQLLLRLNQSRIQNPTYILASGGEGQFPINRWLGIGLSTTNGVAGTVALGGGRLSELWAIKLVPGVDW